MDNKHIGITTEASSEGRLNNCTEPSVSRATDNLCYSEKAFDNIVNTIKAENYSLFRDESSELEDFASIAYKSIDHKNEKQQDQMCELASTSDEKDVNVSESNSQELTDTKLVDGKIVRMHTSSLSTALPIMNISPKSGPHICLECCFKCSTVFRVLDSPLHIHCIQSIDKQNEFLIIEPSLFVDSCLCVFCWKYLEKTYKSNKSKNRKEESYSEKKSRLLECYVKKNVSKKQNQARRCSIHLCSRPYSHKMSINEWEHLKKLFLTFESCHFVFVESRKQTGDFLKFPFCLCKIHNAMILVMSTCQICGGKLNAPFNPNDWSMHKMWNFVLTENNLPLILKPGMFICVTCKGHISKTNPDFPTIDLPRLREYIIINNEIRLKLYGEPKYNLFSICQGSTYVPCPIVAPKIREEKERVRSTKVKFFDPLITTNYNSEIGYHTNNIESITSTALLNVAEQNMCTNKLDPKDKGLDFVKLEEKYLNTFTANKPKDQLCNFYTNLTPNISDLEIINSLNKSVDNISENILSEQNPSANLTDNYVSNNVSNYFSFAETNHVVIHDHNKDLLRLHIDHQLKNYDDQTSKNEGINQFLGIANDNSLQNVCQVDNVEIDENKSVIIGSRQVFSGHNEIENNQNKLNHHAIFSVARDRNSMNIKEAAIEPPNAIVNPILTKRKESNVICDTTSNKDVKKQRLNEKYISYDINSTDDNTTKSYRNKNNAHPSINSPNLSIDVDDDIELNTNVTSIHIEKDYSLDLSCVRPLQFKRTLKNIPQFCNKEKSRKINVNNFLLDKDTQSGLDNPKEIGERGRSDY